MSGFTTESQHAYSASVNKLDHVNLNNCFDEPIHTINAVQACGYVLVVCADTSTIAQVSENITDFGYNPCELIGKPISTLFDGYAEIQARGQVLQAIQFQPHLVPVDNRSVKVEIITEMKINVPADSESESGSESESESEAHRPDVMTEVTVFVTTSNIPRHFVLELEPKSSSKWNSVNPELHIIKNSIDAILQETCSKLRSLTGFHQGMVYRFDADKTGEIVFEEKESLCCVSYKGMRFPSTDIPQQARLLYLRNGVRFIHDTHETPCPLFPARIDNQHFLDLSEVKARASSPIHIAYLKNIGVRSSLSVAISIHDQLWGLFSFHHRGGPLFVDWNKRRICGILAAIASMRIESLAREQDSRNTLRITDAFTNVFQGFQKVIGFFDFSWDMLAEIFKVSSGIISRINDQERGCFGKPIDNAVADYLVSWATKVQHIEFTNDVARWVSERDSESREIKFKDGVQVGGVVLIRLYSYVIVFLRPSSASEASWSGCGCPSSSDDPLKCLGPELSFQKYLKEVGTSSKQWTASETTLFGMLFDKLLSADHREQSDIATMRLTQVQNDMKNAVEDRKRYSQFVANISHELRTPFSATMASLELVLSSKDLPHKEIIEYVRSAHRSGSHMLRILNDFLFVNKISIDASTFQLISTVYNTNDLCGVRSWPSVSIDFCNNAVVTGDPDRVTQVFDNLITNAVKFSEEKEVKVKLAVKRTLEEAYAEEMALVHRFSAESRLIYEVNELEDHKVNQVFLAFSVEDIGIGINRNDIARVFTPFGQVNRITTRRFQGTGLGLSICRELVSLMKGRLTCHSAVGVGTTMFCLVPTTFGNMEQERGIANRLPSTSITDSILLVDDQKVNLRLLKKQVELTHPHATILLAKDGLEATELFEEHVGKIKLVLIDYHTPRMDGKEATRRMRAMEAERGVTPCHIYLLTADSVEKSERTSIAIGITDVILKPLKLDLLRTL